MSGPGVAFWRTACVTVALVILLGAQAPREDADPAIAAKSGADAAGRAGGGFPQIRP